MNDHQALIQAWLKGETSSQTPLQYLWDPGFDAERTVVVSNLLFLQRVFERPVNFTPTFFQKVICLPIEYWSLEITHRLYGGFCEFTVHLEVYFQATVQYAQNNRGLLLSLNDYIKTTYAGVINDLVSTELNSLQDGDWVEQGLTETERKIECVINETLLLMHIQSRTRCELMPRFSMSATETLDGRIVQDVIYHKVMAKDYAFLEKQAQAQYRQAEELERLRLEHAKKQLDVIQQEESLQRQKQALEAELLQKRLAEQEVQRQRQHEIEVRLQHEKAQYEKELKEIELESVLEFEKEKQKLEQQLAVQKLEHHLLHEQVLRTKRGFEEAAYIAQQQKTEQLEQEKELQRKRLDLEIQLKEEESQQLKRQKLAEKLATLKIEHEARINKMNLDAEVKALELRAETLKSKDEYLHREIEWLVLDKQRAELTRLTQEQT